jgi:hypothetical protein
LNLKYWKTNLIVVDPIDKNATGIVSLCALWFNEILCSISFDDKIASNNDDDESDDEQINDFDDAKLSLIVKLCCNESGRWPRSILRFLLNVLIS